MKIRFKIGQKVKCHDRLVRCTSGKSKEWKYLADSWHKVARPVEGFFMGWRMFKNGDYYHDGYDDWVMHNKEYVKVAIVVINERSKPVAVKYEDLKTA